jgi:nitric oxide reductase subunit B
VLPVGFLQLAAVFTGSYAAGRSLAFYNQPIVQTLFWARLPVDTLITLGTAIYAADFLHKRFVLRPSEDDLAVDDMGVAEGCSRRLIAMVCAAPVGNLRTEATTSPFGRETE